MPRTVIAGEPGETWQNDTGKILWQLIVSFFNSCGLCISNANQISTWWPIPFHRGCACTQVPVAPGHLAAPFIDYMEAIRDLPPTQKIKVMGKGLWTLVDKGVVDYAEAVTKARVRTLAEVVGRNKLSVADLTGAGLTKARAELAWRSAHTEAISAAEQQRRAMVGILKGHGLSDAQIKSALATEISARVGIAGKPKPPPPPAPKPTPKPKPVPKPGTPILPGHPIAARLAAWKEGDTIVQQLVTMGEDIEKERAALKGERDAKADQFFKVNQTFKKKKDREEAARRLEAEFNALDDRRGALAFGKAKMVAERFGAADRLGITIEAALPTNPLGPEYVRPDKDLMERAEKVQNWLNQMVGRSGPGETPISTWVAQFSPNSVNQRANYSDYYSRTSLAKGDSEETIAHEAGHALEHQVPGLGERAREFRKHRVGTEQPTNLAAKFGANAYDSHEEGYPDDFGRFFSEAKAYYTGKIYADGSTEIISMGVQALYNNPTEFARRDPEYAKFILGILRGDLR